MKLDLNRVREEYNKIDDLFFGDCESVLETKTALLIFERVYDVEKASDITEEMVDIVSDIVDRWESIYRDEINSAIDMKINYGE